MTKENQTSHRDDRSELSSQKGQEQRFSPKIRKTVLTQERERFESHSEHRPSSREYRERHRYHRDERRELKDKDDMIQDVDEKRVQQRHASQSKAERREEDVRRKVKLVYLALIVLSLAIIVSFAFLLKNKLRAIKTLPTEPSGQQYFEENPRITIPRTENTELREEGLDEEEVDPSNSEEPNSSDSSQP